MRIPQKKNVTTDSERVNKEFERISNEEADAGETVVIGECYEPQTDLAKLLLVLVQEVGSMQPQAFKNVRLNDALKQADAIQP